MLKNITVENHDGVQLGRVRVWSEMGFEVAWVVYDGLGHMENVKSMYFRPTYNNRQAAYNSQRQSIESHFLHGLVSNHDRLLVDVDLCRVDLGPADSSGCRLRVGFHDDSANRTREMNHQPIEGDKMWRRGCRDDVGSGNRATSSIVLSERDRLRPRFSRSFRPGSGGAWDHVSEGWYGGLNH